jgi:hypothetical protein
MHIYQLDDKNTDQDFLSGKIVSGKAVLSTSAGDPPQPGEAIMVILSNGKKYKGTVTKVSLFVLREYRIGEIEFIKSNFYRN